MPVGVTRRVIGNGSALGSDGRFTDEIRRQSGGDRWTLRQGHGELVAPTDSVIIRDLRDVLKFGFGKWRNEVIKCTAIDSLQIDTYIGKGSYHDHVHRQCRLDGQPPPRQKRPSVSRNKPGAH